MSSSDNTQDDLTNAVLTSLGQFILANDPQPLEDWELTLVLFGSTASRDEIMGQQVHGRSGESFDFSETTDRIVPFIPRMSYDRSLWLESVAILLHTHALPFEFDCALYEDGVPRLAHRLFASYNKAPCRRPKFEHMVSVVVREGILKAYRERLVPYLPAKRLIDSARVYCSLKSAMLNHVVSTSLDSVQPPVMPLRDVAPYYDKASYLLCQRHLENQLRLGCSLLHWYRQVYILFQKMALKHGFVLWDPVWNVVERFIGLSDLTRLYETTRWSFIWSPKHQWRWNMLDDLVRVVQT